MTCVCYCIIRSSAPRGQGRRTWPLGSTRRHRDAHERPYSATCGWVTHCTLVFTFTRGVWLEVGLNRANFDALMLRGVGRGGRKSGVIWGSHCSSEWWVGSFWQRPGCPGHSFLCRRILRANVCFFSQTRSRRSFSSCHRPRPTSKLSAPVFLTAHPRCPAESCQFYLSRLSHLSLSPGWFGGLSVSFPSSPPCLLCFQCQTHPTEQLWLCSPGVRSLPS